MKGLRKNTFIGGTVIATLGIVLSKILGIVYVIPFYDLIGDQGGALYGYAYTIYSIFLGISTVGLPFAMSKIISEYHTLNYEYLKEKAFVVGKKIMWITGFSSFIILFIFAKPIAYAIIGNSSGGNSIEDVTTVIKILSTALIVVPIMSIQRGYLQGQKYITPSSISQVLEQIARVIVILVGSYLSVKVFRLNLTTVVGISVFAATISAFVAYFYLLEKIRRNKKKLNTHALPLEEEKKVTGKMIAKKLIIYAIPFVSISVISSLYDMINLFTIIKTLVDGLNYSKEAAETIMGVITTWGYKLNMIVTSISMGLTISLIPNITSSFVLKDKEDLNHKINQSLQIILFIVAPIAILLSVLSTPVWTVFYGNNEIGILVFSHSIFTAFFLALFTTVINIVQAVNSYKWVFISLIAGVLVKIISIVPLMHALYTLGFDASYGITISTALGYMVSTAIGLIYLKKKFNINYLKTSKILFKALFGILIMLIVVYLMQIVIPINTESRLQALLICALYAVIPLTIYFLMGYKNKSLETVLGHSAIAKVFKILHIKRK